MDTINVENIDKYRRAGFAIDLATVLIDRILRATIRKARTSLNGIDRVWKIWISL